MKTTLSLLCSLSLSLGWCFSQLTKYTCNMHTYMHIYIHINKWRGQMNTSEQTLIKEICQGLSHGQKGRQGWVHADHLMVWISCGSHSQSLTHAIFRVKLGKMRSKFSFQTDRIMCKEGRWPAGMWYNSGCPKISSGLAMSLIWLQCLITVVPKLLTLLVRFECSCSCGCLRIWLLLQRMRWYGKEDYSHN